jgi:hypothetical protein
MRFVHGEEARERSVELENLWPQFLTHGSISNRYWNRLYDDFPDFQFVLLDDGDRAIAEGNCVPVDGMPEQWRAAFVAAWEAEGEPDRVCALAIIVLPSERGRGTSCRAYTGCVSHPGFDGDFAARVRLAEGEVCHAESEEVSGGAVGACDAVGVRVGASDRARRCRFGVAVGDAA